MHYAPCPYHQRFSYLQPFLQPYPQPYPQYTQNQLQPSYAGYYNFNPQQLASETLTAIEPAVANGLKEAQTISVPHALKEASAISYLMGKGLSFNAAHEMVESWWKAGILSD